MVGSGRMAPAEVYTDRALCEINVRFGSKADMPARSRHVRFTPA